MNFENEVFGLARVRINEVRISEGLLYLCYINYINTLVGPSGLQLTTKVVSCECTWDALCTFPQPRVYTEEGTKRGYNSFEELVPKVYLWYHYSLARLVSRC